MNINLNHTIDSDEEHYMGGTFVVPEIIVKTHKFDDSLLIEQDGKRINFTMWQARELLENLQRAMI